MAKTPIAPVYHVSFLLLLTFCLGFASRLYAAMYDEKKVASSSQPYTANNEQKAPQNDLNRKGNVQPISKQSILKSVQMQKKPTRIEKTKQQTPQQAIDGGYATFSHSVAQREYQIPANKQAASNRLLLIVGLPMGRFMQNEMNSKSR